MKPLVVKLSMVVVLALDTRRQRESRRMLRAPRMRREPPNRRGFKQFIFLAKSLVSEPLMISVPPHHEYEDNM